MLLRTIAFHATPAGQTVLQALAFLAANDTRRRFEYGSAPLEGIATRLAATHRR